MNTNGGGAGGIMGIGLTLTVGNTKAESKSADCAVHTMSLRFQSSNVVIFEDYLF